MTPCLSLSSAPEQLAMFAERGEPGSFSAIISADNLAEVPRETFDTSQWGEQLRSVYDVMKDGRWRTLAEIAFEAHAPEASVSARIRDLKKKGIFHEKRKAREGGLFEYRLLTGNS